MKTETLMWLLVCVFMFHDFEEIVMMIPWARKNERWTRANAPAWLSQRVLGHFSRLSTSSFTLAVAEEFVVLSTLTFLAVEWNWYSFWAGLTLVFAVHLGVHFVQFVAFRRYVPVILTVIPAGLYCAYALWWMNDRHLIAWDQVGMWTVVLAIGLGANLMLALALGKRFETWLRRYLAGN